MAKKIVIVGGGFAGLNLARHIDTSNCEVTLVDRNNYIFFPPLLYQVATGFLEASNISYPYRKMLRSKPNFNFKIGEVIRILPSEKMVVLTSGALSYDYLVFATGTETNYFGLENVRKKAIPMKTVNDALEMRNYILNQLERATAAIGDPDRLRKLLTIVVAGGGPTGVEISGLLAEMCTSVIPKDYPELRKANACVEIFLVDGLPQLLTAMSKKSQQDTHEALDKLGVKMILNAQVKDYLDDKVMLSTGQVIETENLIWAAGVTAQVFEGIPEACFGKGKRMVVDGFNELTGLKDVYAIGDTCFQTADPEFPGGHPQLAQVALQQGKALAENFGRLFKNGERKPFRYSDRGSMAIIGRNKAVADLPAKLHFKGFIAWFMWVFIHLISLVHYRNRITTLYNWIIAYFTKDQALRMIIRPFSKRSIRQGIPDPVAQTNTPLQLEL